MESFFEPQRHGDTEVHRAFGFRVLSLGFKVVRFDQSSWWQLFLTTAVGGAGTKAQRRNLIGDSCFGACCWAISFFSYGCRGS